MTCCPNVCGYLGDADDRSRCATEQVQRYRARFSWLTTGSHRSAHRSIAPAIRILGQPQTRSDDSAGVRARVNATRDR